LARRLIAESDFLFVLSLEGIKDNSVNDKDDVDDDDDDENISI